MPDKETESLQQLLDSMPVLVVCVDRDGMPGWANRTFRDMFPGAVETARRTGRRTVFADLDPDLPELVSEVLESGVVKTGLIETVDVPGAGAKTFTLSVLPFKRKDAGSGRAILFAVDITGQADMERLKKEAYEQIEKNIEQFAILGDHIRNPVAVITGLCDLLDDTVLAEKILHQAQEIDRIVTRIDQGWIESEKVRGIIKKYYDVGVSGTHELVARAIHEEYIAQQRAAGQTPETNPSMRPWNELSRNLQESNLRQADDIWRKLSEIRCVIGLSVDARPAPFAFTPDEIELLAMHEHERWVTERIKRGWTFGPVVNVQERIHNCLVPWTQLPEDQREKDRNTLRTLPSVLAKVRLRIIRLP